MYRVLYVDDESSLLEITKLFLEARGEFSLDTEISAQDGLKALQKQQYDCVISDYQMPKIDGIAFLKEVRSQFGTIPFILFTGKGREEIVIEAFNNGADSYIQKGGDPKSQFFELAHKVRISIERRRSEEALRINELRLQRAELVAQLGHWEFYMDTGKVIASAGAKAIYGVHSPDFSIDSAQNIPLPEYRPILDNALKELMKQGKPYDLEFKIGRLDTGDVRDIHSLASYDPKRHVVFGVIQDITRHKKDTEELEKKNEELAASFEQVTATEEELRQNYDELAKAQHQVHESEHRFHSLFDRMIDGMALHELIVDTTGTAIDYRILEVNPAFEKILGIPRDTVGGKTSCEAYGVTQPPYLDIYSRVAMGGEPVSFETYFAPMEKHFLISVYSPEKGFFATVFEDITERKKAEEALGDREKTVRAIFENTFQFIGLMTPEGILVEANRTALDFAGVSRNDVINRPFWETPWWQGNTAGVQQLKEAIDRASKGKFVRYEVEIQGVGNTTMLVDFSINPVFDSDGRIWSLISEARDITRRKQAEEALIRANRQLNLMTSITRHDILNKLSIIHGYLELMRMKFPDPALAEYVSKLENTKNVIQSQIEFTAVYQDLGTQEPQWQEPGKLVRHLHVPDPVALTMDLQGAEVLADPMLEKVFFNLLDNSLRHGQHVTEIGVSSRQSDDGLVVVWVDNGVGVKTEEKTRIFERGYGKNTGLGLFLVREILSITNMAIKETGIPGKGARFEILVPKGAYRFATM